MQPCFQLLRLGNRNSNLQPLDNRSSNLRLDQRVRFSNTREDFEIPINAVRFVIFSSIR